AWCRLLAAVGEACVLPGIFPRILSGVLSGIAAVPSVHGGINGPGVIPGVYPVGGKPRASIVIVIIAGIVIGITTGISGRSISHAGTINGISPVAASAAGRAGFADGDRANRTSGNPAYFPGIGTAGIMTATAAAVIIDHGRIVDDRRVT